MRNFFIPWTSSEQHTIMPNQGNTFVVIKPNIRHYKTNKADPWLHCNSRGGSYHVQYKRHETRGAQQRQLPQQSESKKPSRRPFIFIKWFDNTTEQQRSTQHGTYNQAGYVISNIGRAHHIIHHGEIVFVHHNHIGRNETQAITNTTTNRQFNGGIGSQR